MQAFTGECIWGGEAAEEKHFGVLVPNRTPVGRPYPPDLKAKLMRKIHAICESHNAASAGLGRALVGYCVVSSLLRAKMGCAAFLGEFRRWTINRRFLQIAAAKL